MMKTTYHCGRMGSARHNARDFDISRAENIDAARSACNVTNYYGQDRGLTMEQGELDFYEMRFRAHLDATNERYRRNGHPERCRSMEQYYESGRYRPEEVIIQIGDATEHVDSATLAKCAVEFTNWMTHATRGRCQWLSISVHMDETTPHVHLRRVWQCPDRDGNWCVSQDGALREMGVPLPDPSRPAGRYNNRKMTWDAAAREKLIDICREHGIEIDAAPEPARRHESVRAYKRQAEQDALHAQKTAELAISRADAVLNAMEHAQDVLNAVQRDYPEVFRDDRLSRAMDDLMAEMDRDSGDEH